MCQDGRDELQISAVQCSVKVVPTTLFSRRPITHCAMSEVCAGGINFFGQTVEKLSAEEFPKQVFLLQEANKKRACARLSTSADPSVRHPQQEHQSAARRKSISPQRADRSVIKQRERKQSPVLALKD